MTCSQERRDYARQRQAVIAANAELRERELIKLASLASAMAGVLRQRGVTDPAASLTAEAGIAVFRIAFERWTKESSQADLPQLHPGIARGAQGRDRGQDSTGGLRGRSAHRPMLTRRARSRAAR